MHCALRTELAAIHKQEAASTGEFIGLLRRDTFGNIARRTRLRNDFLVLFVLIVSGCDAILQNRIKIGFDVIGVDLILILFLVFALWSGGKGGVLLSIVFVDEGHVRDVFVEHIAFIENVVEVINENVLSLEINLDLDSLFEILFVDRCVSHGFLAVVRVIDQRMRKSTGGS